MNRIRIASIASAALVLSGAMLLGQASPVPPSKSTTDAITNVGAAATATREAYINACRSMAVDFGVKLPVTITAADGSIPATIPSKAIVPSNPNPNNGSNTPPKKVTNPGVGD